MLCSGFLVDIVAGKCKSQNRLRCGTIKDFPEIQISLTHSRVTVVCLPALSLRILGLGLGWTGPTPLGRPMFPKLQTPIVSNDDRRPTVQLSITSARLSLPLLPVRPGKPSHLHIIFAVGNSHTGRTGLTGYGIRDRHSWRPRAN